ncbi:hypothetical protein NC652_006712 [Populus alba x Populus x berolinensis]|nr:hypothetical protein NC652_006712 [Populus alba x Populus x berolinensis]
MASSFVMNGKYKDDCLSQIPRYVHCVLQSEGNWRAGFWVFRGGWKKDLISWKDVDSCGVLKNEFGEWKFAN